MSYRDLLSRAFTYLVDLAAGRTAIRAERAQDLGLEQALRMQAMLHQIAGPSSHRFEPDELASTLALMQSTRNYIEAAKRQPAASQN
jgi:hypothetical protein